MPGQVSERVQTIFLMLVRLKLPVLRCFCTWLAEPWRALPLLHRLEVGDSSTFSLSIPAERQRVKTHAFKTHTHHYTEIF